MLTEKLISLIYNEKADIIFANLRHPIYEPSWKWWVFWAKETEEISPSQVEETLAMVSRKLSAAERKRDELKKEIEKLRSALGEKEVKA